MSGGLARGTRPAAPEAVAPRDVTCVIVAYHRPALLGAQVARLVNGGLPVIVVNVEADPEVRAVVERRGGRTVDLADNPGYAAAVNTGVGAARTELVVFMNDDAWIQPEAVRRLAAVVGSGAAEVAVPRVIDDTGRPELSIAAVPTPASLAREWLLLPDRPIPVLRGRLRVQKWRDPRTAERIDAAAAVVVATTRALVRQEPLPDAYFLYWEESEWFWRLRERRAVVEYRPEVECVHAGGREDVRSEKSRLLARNAVRCVRRTQGVRRGAIAWIVVVAWNLRLTAADGLRFLRRPTPDRRARLVARWAGLVAACGTWRELR
ncbi:MAG: hypothetical protein AMXMBFR46_15800 [Acidimicrobiia bacterium]